MPAILIAALSALAVAVTLGMYRNGSHWVGHALRQTMTDAITDTVQPQLTSAEARLTAQITNLREAGTAEHAVVALRLTALEERVAALEACFPVDSD